MKSFFFWCLVLLPLGAAAQPETVLWTAEAEAMEDGHYQLTLRGEIEPGWYVYSQYLESNDGPIATELFLESPEGAARIGKTEERGEKVDGYDQIFGMNIAKFKKEMILTQTLRLPEGTAQLSGYVTFMTCNDEMCLPPRDYEFTLDLD